MASKLILIIGSGPGIGSTTASHFASQGFNVALVSRNADRLKDDAAKVEAAGSSGVKVKTFPVDIGDHDAFQSTLQQVKDSLGAPEVVLFNAARVAPSEFGKIDASRLAGDFQFMNISLYLAAVWALPLLESVKQQNADSRPSFLITGGGLWDNPTPSLFVLSMQKAAQVNFAGSFGRIAAPKGVHVATVSVNGMVQDSNPVINAKNIASTFWKLYSQEKNDWETLVNVGEWQQMD